MKEYDVNAMEDFVSILEQDEKYYYEQEHTKTITVHYPKDQKTEVWSLIYNSEGDKVQTICSTDRTSTRKIFNLIEVSNEKNEKNEKRTKIIKMWQVNPKIPYRVRVEV